MKHIDETETFNRVDPMKDVDGFNTVNIGKLCQEDASGTRYRSEATAKGSVQGRLSRRSGAGPGQQARTTLEGFEAATTAPPPRADPGARMSREEAERLLDGIEAEERDRLRERLQGRRETGDPRREKDW